MKIAIMQPYFIPYAGYFRLFAVADLFVSLDCVQFPRRGWVHRNKLIDSNQQAQWLTLPFQKSNRDSTRICDLEFSQDLHELIRNNEARFAALKQLKDLFPDLYEKLSFGQQKVTHYLTGLLEEINGLVGIHTPIISSSTLKLPESIKGQERIIAICKYFEASEYINAPGGKALYSSKGFDQAELTLGFLRPYDGSFNCIVERLVSDGKKNVSEEINQNLSIEYPNA